MRKILPVLLTSLLFGCNQPPDNTKMLQDEIDKLEKKLADNYKPGLGEFMSSIQAHHSKLWFAGKNENWKLAEFEIHEIEESVEDIEKFQKEEKESELIVMIKPALDSMDKAIEQKSLVDFNRNFILLTNTCNNCHRAAEHEFNVIKVPDSSPFTNQDFSLPK